MIHPIGFMEDFIISKIKPIGIGILEFGKISRDVQVQSLFIRAFGKHIKACVSRVPSLISRAVIKMLEFHLSSFSLYWEIETRKVYRVVYTGEKFYCKQFPRVSDSTWSNLHQRSSHSRNRCHEPRHYIMTNDGSAVSPPATYAKWHAFHPYRLQNKQFMVFLQLDFFERSFKRYSKTPTEFQQHQAVG